MRRRRWNSRRLLGVVSLAVAALVFGGCDWTMFGYDAALTHSSPDTAINSANVSTLQPLFTTPGQFTSPVESNGVVYVGNTSGNLEAFDANGVTNCSGTPNQCTPLWTGTTPAGSINAAATPAVANGVVYVSTQATSTSPGGLYAFDANGVTNCSGTPKVCQPLWTAPSAVSSASPIVANGVVNVGAQAFDANGVTNCSGTPKVCQALWTSSVPDIYNAPAVANGVLYATGQDGDTLYAFSAGGTTDCSGTPTTCAPLWTAHMGTGVADMSSPAVSGGVVYAEFSNELFAFDANGVTNCSGTPTTCSPLWTAALTATPGSVSSPAVANGIVYASSNTIQAFDANGVTNCSGTPKTCTPLWSYDVVTFAASPSVADGLLFIGEGGASESTGSEFWAFDANGKTDCSGTPTVCQPLWTGATTGVVTGSPAIANGKVYVTDNSFSFGFSTHLYAWVLPPPTITTIEPSNGNTVSGTQGLDALASAGVTQVQYELTGGTLNHSVIATVTSPSLYGWTAAWNTTTVPNGVYTLQSVASYGGEVSGTSPPITITVHN